MLNYRIASIATLGSVLADFRPQHLVSFLDPGSDDDIRIMHAGALPSHRIVMKMHDVDLSSDDIRSRRPHPMHIASLQDFALGHLRFPDQRVVFQCSAGRRRSTAAALICDLVLQSSQGRILDRGDIQASLDRLKQIQPIADPNRALVALADARLGLGGMLSDVLDANPRYLDLTADVGDQVV